MQLLKNPSIRTRYLLTYSAILCAGAVVLVIVFPQQRWPVNCEKVYAYMAAIENKERFPGFCNWSLPFMYC